jgi:hypothetical protein
MTAKGFVERPEPLIGYAEDEAGPTARRCWPTFEDGASDARSAGMSR